MEEAELGLHESPRGWRSQRAGEGRVAPGSARDPQSVMLVAKLPTSRKRTAGRSQGTLTRPHTGPRTGRIPTSESRKPLSTRRGVNLSKELYSEVE